MKKVDRSVYVLDSFALLAYLEAEGGAGQVGDILAKAHKDQVDIWISIINYGEVLYITERERGLEAAHKTIAVVDQLQVLVAEADRALTFTAAHIKARHAISYADAFAVALAQSKGGPVVTGDPEFKKVEALIPIKWLSQ